MANWKKDSELLDFMEIMGLIIAEDQEALETYNFSKINEVKGVYKALKQMFSKENEVKCLLHQPFKSSGSVSVIGENIVIEDVSGFLDATSQADNFHIYSKTNGDVVVELSFEGLMR